MTDDIGDPCTRVERPGPDGAALTICAHGGHVLGWRTADGVERLWTSPLARCGPGEAIRGGIPVIFPQFAARGPLPRHGFVRDRAWVLTPLDGAAASAVLRSDPGTRAIWPHDFTLALTARAAGRTLTVDLQVTNDGDGDLAFSAALHAYLATSDATSVRVHGLGGRPAEQNADLAVTTLPDEVGALGPVDVSVRDVRGAVTLTDPALGRLGVTADGFADRVLWNPGPAHGLSDVPADGASHFVCVEPAALAPVTLGGGRTWSGRLVLTAL